MPAQNNRLLNLLLRQVNKVDTRSSSAINLVKPIVPGTGSAPRTASNKPPIAPQKLSLPGIEKISARVTNGKLIANSASGSTHNNLPTQPPPTLANTHLALVDGVTPGKVNPGQPQAQASTPPTLLQTLLQMVPKLADIDAQRIKQWFEFASLIRAPKTRSSASLSTDSLQTLKPLVDKNAFSRELELSLQPRTKSTAANETPTVKPMPQETLLAQVRDGVKLVEQALSQNLLQRASLGMQHETQQPLSLNFALPFIDQQEVKPLHVDLQQRDQPQEDKDKSWDIRLSFELADLGPVACHIFLQGEAVAVSFYCEKSHTRIRVEQALPELKQQLSVAGFTAGEFHSFPGKPVQPQTSTATSYTESLIDIEV
jgi:flagellar hook-length control protein FliK